MHCDFAFWVGGTHDNVADLPELERLPGAAGIKVFMGSSTGKLLVADDAGVLAILKQTRRRAAFHSEDEPRLVERRDLRVAGDPTSHHVWRDVATAVRSTERLIRLAREARAQVHVLHISTREEIALLQAAKDVASCEATPHHLTLERRRLCPAGDETADEPAGARSRASRRRVARPRPGRHRRASAPTTRRTRWKRRRSPIRRARRA